MALPNFLLIGAPKAGTTSIHHYLGQHPDVFTCPVKEPAYFVYAGRPGAGRDRRNEPFVHCLGDYERLFAGVRGESAIGESSPYYLELADAEVADRIRDTLPGVRLIAVLRHPVDAGYSRYLMDRRDGRLEPATFEEALVREQEFGRAGPGAVAAYFFGAPAFSRNLEFYFERFPRERIHVALFDDFSADPAGFVRSLYRFLCVDESFVPDTSVRLNPGGLHRRRTVAWLLNRPNPVRAIARWILPRSLRESGRRALARKSVVPAPRIAPETRAELSALLGDEFDRLEKLTGLDLDRWR